MLNRRQKIPLYLSAEEREGLRTAGRFNAELLDVLRPLQLPAARRVVQGTDRIDLISGTRINARRSHVMTVQVLDRFGQPLYSSTPVMLRGSVVDRYEGSGRWSAA